MVVGRHGIYVADVGTTRAGLFRVRPIIPNIIAALLSDHRINYLGAKGGLSQQDFLCSPNKIPNGIL